MTDKRVRLASVVVAAVMVFLVAVPFAPVAHADTVFEDDWESGIGSWYVTNGVWQVGVPTVGPDSTHSGVQCAATVLDGNYPGGSDTHLVSPRITLSSEEGAIRLQFWHWYSLAGGDEGRVDISTDNGTTWVTISDPAYVGTSPVWTQACVDLSAYAGESVRLAFHFTSDGSWSSSGWYVDDVSIVTGQVFFENPEDFESGVGDWCAGSGQWEVGTPTSGPGGAHTGDGCAGTILGGGYPVGADSRLISPEFELADIEPYERIRLRFWHWYSLDSGDVGRVDISTDNGATWVSVSEPAYVGTSPVWTQACVDLSAYAGESVRLAFHFTSDGNWSSSGWYVDDVSIVTGQVFFENPEDFESGVGDWCASNGQWEIGTPTSGPGGAHAGDGCAGTVLGGGYPVGADSRLVSTQIALIRTEPEAYIDLFFWHWFSFDSGDQGQPQISVDGGVWRDLQVPGAPFTGASGGWTQGYADLTAFADSLVQIGFRFASDGNWSSTGWYIDDLRIEGIVPQTGVPEYPEPVDDPVSARLFQNRPNPCNPSTMIRYYVPASCDVVMNIYNTRGQLVRTLVDGVKDGGYHEILWDGTCEGGRAAASGVYLYRLQAMGVEEMRRMVLLR